MLNRRHLRIKVFQAIYSYFRGAKNDLSIGERELLSSVNRIHELFVLHASVFIELRGFAYKRIQERKNKRLPSQEDLNPNLRFVENEVLKALSNSLSLQKKVEEYKISWNNHGDVIQKLFKSIEDSDTYGKYMSGESLDLEQEKSFLIKIYREFIADNEILQDFFEERSIHWSDDHYFVCGYIVKYLKGFQSRFFQNFRPPELFKDVDDDIEFIQTLYRYTLLNSSAYQDIIMDKAKNWEADRIAVVDFILMKMAVCELVKIPSVPIKVTLNEYIELSKTYSTPKSRVFINGILDKIVPDLKQKGEIKKIGRGLMS
ncbi:MAG: transcription antitermination factor NusB [Flavobacteriales bacterium]|nr:transcription antitermination factor NusB [Flavobacteriales bacterium]|tara:strand:- start:56 stop:1003 length:948 start_codon:yes stop_codon:yes gene_type:complete